jgi:hypothetical protein
LAPGEEIVTIEKRRHHLAARHPKSFMSLSLILVITF